jgi:hypothetical protein
MLTARIRTYATTSRLLVLLALFALGGTACSDLEGALPIDDLPGASEDASEDPADTEADDEASEPASDPPEADGDAAAEDEAAADDAEAADDAGAVEPITAADIEEICADEEASATTAEELAPLVGTTPAAFQELVCSSL